ncbi:MAG: DUF1565 domain-containing protein [Deltaproteobacteria bacterium]|nr:DUF1565 domain-containing protein [Deltaproteobacteria bacterium]
MKQSNFKKLLAFLPFFALATGCTTDYFVGDCYDPYYGYYSCNAADDVYTIQGAIDLANPGDTVYLQPGTYSPSTNGEYFPIYMKNGVSIKAESPANTILDAQGANTVLNLFNYNTGIISNLTIVNGRNDLGGGIYAENSSGILSNLYITGNRADTAGSGIYAKNSNGLIINNVVVSGNSGTGQTSDHPAQVEIDDGNVTFNNNVVAFGDSDGLRLNFGATGGFENNIFYQNGFNGFGAGFADTDATTSADILYNICFDNSEADFYLNGTDLTANQANGLGGSSVIANNFSTDPLFYDASNDDFTLQNSSPAINAGDPSPSFNNPDGSRNDIGAFGGPFAE